MLPQGDLCCCSWSICTWNLPHAVSFNIGECRNDRSTSKFLHRSWGKRWSFTRQFRYRLRRRQKVDLYSQFHCRYTHSAKSPDDLIPAKHRASIMHDGQAFAFRIKLLYLLPDSYRCQNGNHSELIWYLQVELRPTDARCKHRLQFVWRAI